MKKVYKYVLPMYDDVAIELPQGAKILKVDTQESVPCIWALVDPDAPLEMRKFRVVGTGHPIEEKGLEFIGTFQMYGGELVFHLFEQTLHFFDRVWKDGMGEGG